MKTIAYTVYDRVAETYNMLFFVESQPQAKRMFSNVVIDGDSAFHKNPSDFVMCEVGTFDDKTGVFEAYDAPQEILDAQEVLRMHYATQSNKKGAK